jgi:hypothetical protein
MRLTLDELEWLSRELARRAEEKRYEEDRIDRGEPLAPAIPTGMLGKL